MYLKDGITIKTEIVENFENSFENIEKLLWVDMFSPNIDEIKWIEKNFEIDFPTKQESEEIEISSRYWEEEDYIMINTYFLINDKENSYNETVTFILRDNIIITVRYKDLKTFNEYVRKLLSNPRIYKNGYYVLNDIFDIRIDIDADILEHIGKELSRLRRLIFSDINTKEEDILKAISHYEELNLKVRENVVDKQRVLSSLLKSNKMPKELKDDMRILIKDINSLIEYSSFNFDRLEYLQNSFLGILSVEQNNVIRIFTVTSVALMPPTLVASIYGMNYQYMPELSWKFGYPFAISLMLISAVVPLIFFKKKGWL